MPSFFTTQLLHWHQTQNDRQMPWKGEKNPYKIWLSEIILQQTRVEQGLLYYEKFVKIYPTIQKLAAAKDESVFKHWEGLGYYSRCRNLLETARNITQNYGGVFPNTYNEIIQLKGVGTYTAAAIASFAYNQPYAVVDGNVFRVLSRFYGSNIAIDSVIGKKEFAEKAQLLLDKNEPALYNQAIMDFGATVCKPKLALCDHCPLQKKCEAFKKGMVYDLPVKEKKLKITHKHIDYYILQYKDKVLVHQRTAQGVWKNLYEFYGIESNVAKNLSIKQVTKIVQQATQLAVITPVFISQMYKQKLTHQHITSRFIKVKIFQPITLLGYTWVNKAQMKKMPFAALINDFLQNDKKDIIFE
jgi:A/G-specific adenine glycosylase